MRSVNATFERDVNQCPRTHCWEISHSFHFRVPRITTRGSNSTVRINTFRNRCKFYYQSSRSFHWSLRLRCEFIMHSIESLRRIVYHWAVWQIGICRLHTFRDEYTRSGNGFLPYICQFVDRFRGGSEACITWWSLWRRFLSGNGYIFRETQILFEQALCCPISLW